MTKDELEKERFIKSYPEFCSGSICCIKNSLVVTKKLSRKKQLEILEIRHLPEFFGITIFSG